MYFKQIYLKIVKTAFEKLVTMVRVRVRVRLEEIPLTFHFL